MPTVLVVDDDARTRGLVGVVLRSAGFEILDADDGDAVVQLVKAQQPVAVVLDLKMTRVSGLDALRALRAAGCAMNGAEADGDELAAGMLLDARTRSVRVGDKEVALSPTEYHLLRTLMRSPGQVFTTAELLAHAWGPSYAGQDEIVRANIYRLRHKLEPVPSEPRYIKGRRGLGYYVASIVL